jgi:hypothetical protein
MKTASKTCILIWLSLHASSLGEQNQTAITAPFPSPETLSYRIEWRMVTAGNARLQLLRSQQDWEIKLNLESAGLVSRLYRIEDNYKVVSNDKFCGVNSWLEAQEGKRHLIEWEQFDDKTHKAISDIHDLVKNVKEHRVIDIAPCTHEIIGALASLRLLQLEPGKWATVPISNGKKLAYAKVQSQAKENITVQGKTYMTTRYEAFIFDNVVFRKKGSLLIWMSDDAAHVPVQMRFQMGFPIGNIGLELEKAEKN